MASADDFYNDEDQYRNRILSELNHSGGIAGPQDLAGANSFPDPFAAAAPAKPAGGFDLEGIRKRLGFGQVDLGNPDAWLAANQDVAQGARITGGKMYDPSGRFMADVISNMKAGGTKSQFLDGIDSATGQKRVAAPAKGKAVTQASGAPSVASAVAPAAPVANPFLQQMRELIVSQMGQMQQPVTGDEPHITGQVDSYRRERMRGAKDERAMLAERAAQNGLLLGGQSSGGFDTAVQGVYENAGEDVASRKADIVGVEHQQRRSQLLSLMNMALQSGDAESARELSMALANLDAQLRREGLAQQGSQFDDDLGYRYSALNQAGNQFNANLGQQRYMYDDTMGFNTWRAGEDDIYRNSVLGAFGG